MTASISTTGTHDTMQTHAETAPLLDVEHLWFHYPLDEAPQRRRNAPDTAPADLPWAVRDVSLTIRPGEFLALVGRNGSGKSTLARCLNGLLRPTRGSVRSRGDDIRDTPVGVLAREVGYVFQNPDHQLFLPSVRREIAWGPTNLGLAPAAVDATTATMLERFGLQEVADLHPALIGRGLRRMTALAAVAALEPQVLILDEPTGGLDHRLTTRLLDLLQRVRAAGTALVLITHDMTLVAEHARRMLILRDGYLLADGDPASLFDDAALLDRAGLLPPETTALAAQLRATHDLPPALATPATFHAAWRDHVAGSGKTPDGGAA